MKGIGILLLLGVFCLTSCGSGDRDSLDSPNKELDANYAIDPSGKRYQTIKLNGQLWLKENMNYELENSWCYAEIENNCGIYGRLYSWEAAKKACAALGPGWRLPTDEEWREIGKSFGGYHDGDKMEDVGDPGKTYKALMKDGNTGFDALLGGWRYSNSRGDFDYLSRRGSYWSATEVRTIDSGFNDESVIYYIFSSTDWGMGNKGVFSRSAQRKWFALSCRCLKSAPSNSID